MGLENHVPARIASFWVFVFSNSGGCRIFQLSTAFVKLWVRPLMEVATQRLAAGTFRNTGSCCLLPAFIDPNMAGSTVDLSKNSGILPHNFDGKPWDLGAPYFQPICSFKNLDVGG